MHKAVSQLHPYPDLITRSPHLLSHLTSPPLMARDAVSGTFLPPPPSPPPYGEREDEQRVRKRERARCPDICRDERAFSSSAASLAGASKRRCEASREPFPPSAIRHNAGGLFSPPKSLAGQIKKPLPLGQWLFTTPSLSSSGNPATLPHTSVASSLFREN